MDSVRLWNTYNEVYNNNSRFILQLQWHLTHTTANLSKSMDIKWEIHSVWEYYRSDAWSWRVMSDFLCQLLCDCPSNKHFTYKNMAHMDLNSFVSRCTATPKNQEKLEKWLSDTWQITNGNVKEMQWVSRNVILLLMGPITSPLRSLPLSSDDKT